MRLEARWERWRPEVQAERWRESDADADGGGLLWDLGSHLIDQALVLFGAAAERVRPSRARARGSPRGRRHASSSWASPTGRTVQLWMSLVAVEPGPRFRVTGLGGLLESHGLDPQEDCACAGTRRPRCRCGWSPRPAASS